VVRKKPRVVHLVDVITGEYQHELRVRRAQAVEVLVNGVRGTSIPRVIQLLLCRHQLDELAELPCQKRPPALHVPDQALRLVLRGDADAPDSGVHAVGEREIYDAELPAERHRRFRTSVGQRVQPGATPAGKNHRISARCERVRQGRDGASPRGCDPA
jgi:hypothetical protein